MPLLADFQVVFDETGLTQRVGGALLTVRDFMPIKAMNLGLQNKPELATEYLDIFVRESMAAACNQSPEPLTV